MSVFMWLYYLPLYIPAIFVLLLTVLYPMIIRMFNHKAKLIVNCFMLALSVILILCATLLGRTSNETREYILIPFYSIYARRIQNEGIRGIIMNTVLFVPFGVCLPYIIKKSGIAKTIATGFLLSLSVEFIQLVLNIGVFEIDDIIFNSFGAALGAASYLIYDNFNLEL